MKKTKLMALTTALLMAVQPICAMGSTIEPNTGIVEVEPRRLWGTLTSDWLNPISGNGVKVKLVYNHELATGRIIDVVGVAAINIDVEFADVADFYLINPKSARVTVSYKKRNDPNTYFGHYQLNSVQ